MTIVSKPTSQAYRDNYPFPDRRVVVVDKPGEPVVGMVQPAQVDERPVAAGPATITASCHLLETFYARGSDCDELCKRVSRKGCASYHTEAGARANALREERPHVFKVEIRITDLDRDDDF